MKIFDKMYKFFESLVEYTKNFSNLFLIFVGAFLLLSVVIIVMTSFAYECKLTKTIDKINKFFERNPKINDDNLVAFNNMMKAKSVPKTLRRQWQQFMLYREHPASYYMSFKHCVENPLRNSTYNQQMTVYRVISFVLIALSFIISAFMTVEGINTNRVLMDILIIPITILVLYWLISMVLNLIHSAVSGDLFQNYQYFEINIDKAMLTLPEFVDYEVLFSQDEIRRGIPVLFAYLQKRAIQEQHELEKARLKSVDHEKFDFDEAGLDGSLVLDRAMRETENYSTQRKKYMQEIERVNNEISVLENNYKEQTKEFQRQVQTSKETVENLKEQLEQAGSTIEINYIKKQMRDEINRQQLSEKDFDILTDKHNQAIKALNQEIKHYEDETKKAKEAMEVAMLSEFNTYSVKVYDNLEKIVDEKMQNRVDDYKDQIKGLEIELEEKNEELENVYTRYQEALTQIPMEAEPIPEEAVEELPTKKNKKKKKTSNDDIPVDDGMTQPELDPYAQPQYFEQPYYDENNQTYYDAQNNQEYVDNYDYNSYGDYDNQNYNNDTQLDNANYDQYVPTDEEYVPTDSDYTQGENFQGYVPVGEEQGEYIPVQNDYAQDEYLTDQTYVPLNDEHSNENTEYVPLGEEQAEYLPLQEQGSEEGFEYVPLQDEKTIEDIESGETQQYTEEQSNIDESFDDADIFDDSDFDIDFSKSTTSNENFEDMNFDFDLSSEKPQIQEVESSIPEEDDGDFDLNKILGLYDGVDKVENKEDIENVKPVEDNEVEDDKFDEDENEVLGAPIVKRKAGRPRKIVDEDDETPKRKPGRPRKIVDENEESKPKRKAGRPRKIVEEVGETTKRKVGRPKKVEGNSITTSKQGRGRPKKQYGETAEVKSSTRGRGRPRKEESALRTTPIKTTTGKRGRPRKQQNNTTGMINNQGVLGKPIRKAGRPRKTDN